MADGTVLSLSLVIHYCTWPSSLCTNFTQTTGTHSRYWLADNTWIEMFTNIYLANLFISKYSLYYYYLLKQCIQTNFCPNNTNIYSKQNVCCNVITWVKKFNVSLVVTVFGYCFCKRLLYFYSFLRGAQGTTEFLPPTIFTLP